MATVKKIAGTIRSSSIKFREWITVILSSLKFETQSYIGSFHNKEVEKSSLLTTPYCTDATNSEVSWINDYKSVNRDNWLTNLSGYAG